jgi:hypothetical protein
MALSKVEGPQPICDAKKDHRAEERIHSFLIVSS